VGLIVWGWSTLAAYRLWRLLALDDLPGLLEARTRLDRWATTDTRARYVDAVRCPWCLGFWCCVLVFVAVDVWGVSLPLPVVQIAAASTVVGLIGSNVDG
jgi:hypothetical protein